MCQSAVDRWPLAASIATHSELVDAQEVDKPSHNGKDGQHE